MLLTYTNDRGQSVSFTNRAQLDITPILLTDADGLHGLPAEVHTLSQYGQDGATYVDSQLPPRHVTLSCKIVQDVINTRIGILRVMNPKIRGTLTLRRGSLVRCLRCAIEEAPSFPPRYGSVFTVGLIAPNPYWMESVEMRHDIAVWEPAFEWPLDIEASGISFGERSASLISNIYNHGDATVGMTVVFTATGDVSNPMLSHVLTFKQMRMLVDLKAGDTITIRTGYGDKEVLLHRAGQAYPQNAMIHLDIANPSFDFIQLEPGDNIVRYDAADGVDNLNVTVYYAPGYLGV